MAAKGSKGFLLSYSMYAIVLMALSVAASAAEDCSTLKQELRLLKEAQGQIHASLIANHESFASVMENYSQKLATVDPDEQPMLAKNMRESAEAFRQRGFQAQKTVRSLDGATLSLLHKAQVCGQP